MPYHYTTTGGAFGSFGTKRPKVTGAPGFEFYRFRFRFRALDRVFFPPHKSGNVFRGAFGALLRETAPPEVYRSLFEPRSGPGNTPSGLADWPRPFLLRTAHLDGMSYLPGDSSLLRSARNPACSK